MAAVGSYLSAKSRMGQWLVRIEDLDPQRSVPGCDSHILRTFEAFGFEWDGEVVYQSRRSEIYAAALRHLEKMEMVYPCCCSRAEISIGASPGPDGEVRYPGTCRSGMRKQGGQTSIRVRANNREIRFVDRFLGPQSQRLESEIGDFVVRRTDGVFSYQLAVVVDDAAQGITEVIRGADLLGSTGRQIYLQRLLGFETPEYGHLPLVVNESGEKLSKQTHAPPLNSANASGELTWALTFLGLGIEENLEAAPLREIWQAAFVQWREKVMRNQHEFT